MKKNRFLWALLLLVSMGAAVKDKIHFVVAFSAGARVYYI